MIEKLLGISMIDKAHKNIRANITDNNNEMDLISEQLKNVDTLNNQLEEKTSEKNQYIKKHKLIKTSVMSAFNFRKKNKGIFEILDKKYKKYNEYELVIKTTQEQKNAENSKLEEIEMNISSATQSKNELKDLEPSIKNYNMVSKKLSALNTLHTKYVEMGGDDERIK